jgi:putative tryptophan/tyrosine transport system substrate-binding protein
MQRRKFIAFLSGAAAAWPLAARAQQPGKIVRVGFLGAQPNVPMFVAAFSGFSGELQQLGYVEGQNLIIEYRYINEPGADVAAQAVDLVRSNIDVLVATGPEVVLRAAIGATSTIPIVMIAINFDPIARGYVSSLARPGSNVTGIFFRQPELAQKQLELLTEAFPGRTKVVALYDALSDDQFTAAKRAAEIMKLEFRGLKLENPPYNFDAAFRVLAKESSLILLVLSSPHFTPSQSRIAALAIEQRLPSMFIFKSYVEAGGLMSYGVDFVAMHRRIAALVGKILKGANPADIPVEQPTKFDLVINLKTARALGLEVPPTLLARADEVIE